MSAVRGPASRPLLTSSRGLQLVALTLAACSAPAPVAPQDFGTRLVGDWLGTVGDDRETVKFGADGSFVAHLRPTGFIDSTLSEGVAGTVRGRWSIDGGEISMLVTRTENERLENRSTTAEIQTFQPNRLVVRSARGVTTAFERLQHR